MLDFRFTSAPAAFLDSAGSYLSADPLGSTVLAGSAAQYGDRLAPPADAWWLTVHRGPQVVGAAMSTPPHPVYLGTMDPETAGQAASPILARMGRLSGVSGFAPAVEAMATAAAAAQGSRVVPLVSQRLHTVVDLHQPRSAPGALRPATAADLGLVQEWFGDFTREADRQAGRTAGHESQQTPAEVIAARVGGGLVGLWEDEGQVVHLVGQAAPVGAVARIGPVYTPAPLRGRGYAASAVASVTAQLLLAGQRPCLFTDLANPVSGALYARLGYRPVGDYVAVRLVDSAAR